MTRRTRSNRCAPVQAWPDTDKARWKTALGAPDPFEPTVGYARRWSPKTLVLVEKGYGRWVNWLEVTGQLEAGSDPEDRPTEERLRAYLQHLRNAGIGDYTIANYIQQLGNALVAIAPDSDWSRILRAAGRIRELAKPVKDVDSRTQPPEVLLQLGMDLMATAGEDRGLSVHERAVRFRDGLMLVLLIHRPLRVENVAQIRIGEHLHRRNGTWWLAFSAAEMKNLRPIEFSLPGTLADPLQRYLGEERRVLLARRHGEPTAALFLTNDGEEMTEARVSERVRARTGRAFEKSVNAHLFRTIAATTVATSNPDNITDVARVLGHSSMRTSERHYVRARTVEAARSYQTSIAALRKRGRAE